MTLGSYQGPCVDGVMWLFHSLSWSSFCGYPKTDVWHVSVNENTSGLVSGFSLVGICTRSPNSFLCGQRRMMREVWTYGADGYMKSGLGRSCVLFSALKGSTPLRITSLC